MDKHVIIRKKSVKLIALIPRPTAWIFILRTSNFLVSLFNPVCRRSQAQIFSLSKWLASAS